MVAAIVGGRAAERKRGRPGRGHAPCRAVSFVTRRPLLICLAVLFAGPTSARAAEERAAPPAASPRCEGAYADDFAALEAEARDFDRRPEAVFSRCTRSAVVYECLSYGPDGAIRRKQRKAVAHGTAFGYRRQGPDTLLLTNEHVASWPAVTDGQHVVEGVPAGCKKISETLTLVDDEHDTYSRDDIPLTRMVADPQLDVAVLRARADLSIMPWKIGHSGALTERNVVEVRGFPLGAFRATNIGKIISPHDHDDFGDWDHDDFVVDALLSAGNSGSPVLAISCATGEYELVGVYHAGYTEGSALNVVIGIDQVRDLMTTLKRSPKAREGEAIVVDGAARMMVTAALKPLGEMFFPFGAQVAVAREAAAGDLLFAVYPKDFPTTSEPLLVIEDRPARTLTLFGEIGDVWLGSPRGLKRSDPTSLGADGLAQIGRTLDALRTDAVGHASYRGTPEAGVTSRQANEQRKRAAKALARVASSRADLWQTVVEMADRLGPQQDEEGTTLAALLSDDRRPSPGVSGTPEPSHEALALSGAAGAASEPEPPGPAAQSARAGSGHPARP